MSYCMPCYECVIEKEATHTLHYFDDPDTVPMCSECAEEVAHHIENPNPDTYDESQCHLGYVYRDDIEEGVVPVDAYLEVQS